MVTILDAMLFNEWTFMARAIISAGSSAMLFAENNLAKPVMKARFAFTTSRMHSLIWEITWLPWGS